MKIKSNRTYPGLGFRPVNYEEVLAEFKHLGTSKTTQLETINACVKNGEFPEKLQTVDITLAVKKGDKLDKTNYGQENSIL